MSGRARPPRAAERNTFYDRVIAPGYRPLARALRHVPPDVLTLASVPFAVAAAACFVTSGRGHEGRLLLGAAFVLASASMDALDGQVARLAGKASKRGDFLDHVLDRVTDAVILGGLAFAPDANRALGLIAVVVVSFVSYLGTQAQALGLPRLYAGLFGRANRTIALLVLLPVCFALTVAQRHRYEWAVGDTVIRLAFLDLVFLLFIVVGVGTAVQRFAAVWRDLADDG